MAETQAVLAKRFGLSRVTVGGILSDYEITTAGNESKEGKTLRARAKEHRGQKVAETQVSLGKQFGLSIATVRKILSEYEITTAGNESEGGKALRAWAKEHRGQKVAETRVSLGEQFGLSLVTVGKILPAYEITTAGNKEKEGKALGAWAKKNRGQKVAETQAVLGKWFGLSVRTVGRILSEYKITTASRNYERTLNHIFILLEGSDQNLLNSIKSELENRGYIVTAIVRGQRQIKTKLKEDSRINFVISEGDVDTTIRTDRKFINLGNFLDKDEELKEGRGPFFDEVDRLSGQDNAQVANGGIDLTSANMNLQTQNAGEGIKFHLGSGETSRVAKRPGLCAGDYQYPAA